MWCRPTTTLELSKHFEVTAVDISERSIEIARSNVPTATFLCSDMLELDFVAGGGVAAFYSIIHVPRREHIGLIRKIADWLKSGGILVASFGTSGIEAEYDDNWLGTPMYWSSYDTATYKMLLGEVGFHIISAREEVDFEDGEPISFLWVVARKS